MTHRTHLSLRCCALIVVGAVALGCSASSSIDPSPPESQSPEGGEPAQRREPFTLSVLQELNDGNRLMVMARLTAATDWNTSDVALRLVALREGEEIAERSFPVALYRPFLAAGENLDIPLMVEAVGITDYNLEAAWGGESARLVGQPPPSGSAGSVGLRNTVVSSERVGCGESGCSLRFQITSEIFNGTEEMVQTAVLGTGFVWVSGPHLDLSSFIPENESQVTISGLMLGPGASQRLRLTLDQTVPERSDGAYKPVLRVVSYNQSGSPASERGETNPATDAAAPAAGPSSDSGDGAVSSDASASTDATSLPVP